MFDLQPSHVDFQPEVSFNLSKKSISISRMLIASVEPTFNLFSTPSNFFLIFSRVTHNFYDSYPISDLKVLQFPSVDSSVSPAVSALIVIFYAPHKVRSQIPARLLKPLKMLLSSHYFVVFFPSFSVAKTFFKSVAVSPDTLKFHHWRREALETFFSFLSFCTRPETHKDSQWEAEKDETWIEWMNGHNSRSVASLDASC